jgi:hypothetical protein
MPSGEEFTGFSELRDILVSTRSEVFTKHLITTFLTYATGRHMEVVDDYCISDIQSRLNAKGNGIGSLVEESLLSEIFRSR